MFGLRPHLAWPLVQSFVWMCSLIFIVLIVPDIETQFFAHGINCDNVHDGGGHAGGGGDGDGRAPVKRHVHAVCTAAIASATLAHSMSAGAKSFWQFLVSPIIGALSDTYGRHRFFVIGAVFSVAPPLCLWLNARVGLSMYLYWSAAALSATNCVLTLSVTYVADITPATQRTAAMMYLLAAVAAGMAVPPVFAFFLSHEGMLRSSVACAVLQLVLSLVQPESMSATLLARAQAGLHIDVDVDDDDDDNAKRHGRRTHFIADADHGDGAAVDHDDEYDKAVIVDTRHGTATAATATLVRRPSTRRTCWSSRYNPVSNLSILNTHSLFRRLAVCAFANDFVFYGLFDILLLFGKRQFAWGTHQNAWASIIVGSTAMVLQTVVMPRLTRAVGERRVVVVGLLIACLSGVMLAIGGSNSVNNEVIVYVALALLGAAFMVFPTIAAVGVDGVTPELLGVFSGALAGLRDVAQGVGPFVFGGLFSLFTRDDSGLFNQPFVPFAVAAICLAVTAVVARGIVPLTEPADFTAWMARKGYTLSSSSSSSSSVVVHTSGSDVNTDDAMSSVVADGGGGRGGGSGGGNDGGGGGGGGGSDGADEYHAL